MWPLANRDALMNIRVYDLLKSKNALLIVGNSLKTGDEVENTGFKVPEPDKGVVRCDSLVNACLSPISPTRNKVILEAKVDLKMVLPSWLINFVTRKLGWHIAKDFRKNCMKLPDEHKK